MTTHDLPAVASEEHAYLTTTGRVTGNPHEIEIWFSTDGAAVHLLSGGGTRSDWVQNLQHDPAATVRIVEVTAPYTARFDLTDDERRGVAERHAAKYSPEAADRWFRDALVVALDPT